MNQLPIGMATSWLRFTATSETKRARHNKFACTATEAKVGPWQVTPRGRYGAWDGRDIEGFCHRSMIYRYT